MAFKHQAVGALPLVQHSENRAEWTDRLAVDHPSVDAQHKVIFEHADEVRDVFRRNANVSDLRVAVDRLHSVLETHFRYEERMLAETAYPHLTQHAAAHRALLDELATVRASLGGDGKAPSEVGGMLLDFLQVVTVGHVLGSDVEYRRYVAANPVDELDVSITAMGI